MEDVTPSVADICSCLEEWAPPELAEEWDNPGLQAGNPQEPVRGILVALDLTRKVISEAVEHEMQMVVTHHPAIFTPIRSITTDNHTGSLLTECIQNRMAVFSAHTNLDSASGGVNDVLCRRLGLQDTYPLVENRNRDGAGLGRIGMLDGSCSLGEFIERVACALEIGNLSYVGDPSATVRKVALCGGSASDLWEIAHEKGADVYLTGEIKHHAVVAAEETGCALIDAGHSGTEWPVVPELVAYLVKRAASRGWSIEVRAFSGRACSRKYWAVADNQGIIQIKE